MAEIYRSLGQVAAAYAIFEQNQVLSHRELNSVGAYLDGQERGTRLALLGAGIVNGLRLSRKHDAVVLSAGIGLTTDGDLIHRTGETVYPWFRPYRAATRPAYAPFGGNDGKPAVEPIYELVESRESNTADLAELSLFTERTGLQLESMVGVLLMESAVTEFDLCTGTDCDNLGQECRHIPRLLLVEQAGAQGLLEQVATPRQAFFELDEIVVVRPVLAAADNTPNRLAQVFRTACTALGGSLGAGLTRLYPVCAPFVGDLFADGDPAPSWLKQLQGWQGHFNATGESIQYYYDFLKDLAETWNDFRACLAGDRTWNCPDPLAFPKHLLLGTVDAAAGGETLRTAFYPSPLVSHTAGQLRHARFLAGKIDTLIRTFTVPTGTKGAGDAAIRITPSRSEEAPLEERAIPWYYRVNTTIPIHLQWNFRLREMGMATANYSYNAEFYGATGAAAQPLAAACGRYPFFRIEGHLGQPVTTVTTALEKLIEKWNLPIAVRAIALGIDRTKVVKRPGIRYTDLHRLHYLFRQDVSKQLGEAIRFSQNFKQKVDKAVRAEVIANRADDAGVTYTGYAKDKNTELARNAAKVRTVLNRSYSQYKTDTTWKANVAPALEAAGRFKTRLSEVVKTEFATPFDTLIGNDRMHWLDWLDDIIKAKDEQEDDKLLFASFLAAHPGLEHAGGVARGGTFVLVHDQEHKVVADFMLPYLCREEAEAEPAQPAIDKPSLRPGWVVGNGITVLPSRNEFVRDKLNVFRDDQVTSLIRDQLTGFKNEHLDTLRDKVETNLTARIDALQKEYLGTVKESTNLMGNALISQKERVSVGDKVAGYADAGLQTMVAAAKEKETVARYLTEKAAQPGLGEAQRAAYRQQADEAENDLAVAIADATQYIADAKIDVAVGSEGMAALLALNSNLGSVTSEAAAKTVDARLGAIKATTANSGLALVMGAMTIGKQR
ncbi:hypothetical protein [Desulfobulbus sp.]|uniref:hypothetical protein n=1 Tax=Desulfobulbus sp. TaxID=895 RepID=UPI00286F9FD5|nr:hypothetical protein [Desulfobulbus sp.]